MIEERRISILENASRLFDVRSPANVSLRDVANAANVSKSLILKEWKTRSYFVIAVLEFERKKIAGIWQDIDEDSSLETLCFKILSSYRVNPRYFSLFAKVSILSSNFFTDFLLESFTNLCKVPESYLNKFPII